MQRCRRAGSGSKSIRLKTAATPGPTPALPPATGYRAFCEHVDRTHRGKTGGANSSSEAEAEAEAAEPSDDPEEPSTQDGEEVKEDKKGKGKEKCKYTGCVSP